LDIDNDTRINVNNTEMVVTNHGSIAYDLEVGDSGFWFPRGTQRTAIFAAGLWLGAVVHDPVQGRSVRVAVGEYSQEFGPGTMLEDGTPAPPNDPAFRVYKISRGDGPANGDFSEWPFAHGAPADTAAPGYDPADPATWVPQIIGDQTLWSVYNDADPINHTNNAGKTLPLGVEVQQTVFGFDRTEPLGNMIFVKYLFINKGQNTLDSTYVSMWSDPDLGGATDDLVGCDTLLSLGYCYNADHADEDYGENQPAVGFDFFQGPIVPSEGDTAHVSGRAIPGYRNLGMVSFNKYINGTDPKNNIQTYNYMRGLDINGDPVVDPTTGQQTRYQVPGDPVTGTGWLDENENDRRLMLSSGPFTMAPGDTQEVVVGILIAQGVNRLDSVRLLKEYDGQAQEVFDLNFRIPAPPPRPEVHVREYDQAVDLIWSTIALDSCEVSEELNQEFCHQGYNVYQGESVAGPWRKIFTYDVEDTVALIYGNRFNSQSNGIETVVLQRGSNSGLQHRVRIEQDYINGGRLINFRPYYYAVTAYSYDTRNVTPYLIGPNKVGDIAETLENSPSAVEAVPKANPGVLEQEAEHTSGVSDGYVEVAYVDQAAIVDHEYQVVFRPNPNDENGDTPYVWDLVDVTAGGQVLLSGMTDQLEDFEAPVTNGFIVNVVGPPLGVKDYQWGPDPSGRWLTGVNFGLSGFFGGLGIGAEFQGSELAPADYAKDLEIRFSQDPSQWSQVRVYWRLTDPVRYETQEEFGTFPGSAWDVTDPENPRRLNINIVESPTENPAKPGDLMWNPDESDLGGREYFYIMNSDYNGSVDYGGGDIPGANGRNSDVLLAGGLRIRPEHSFLESDGVFSIQLNRINTEADVFAFRTSPLGSTEGTTVGLSVENVRAVPNPYLNQSAYESNQFDRILRFVNLPAADAKVRIFNLAGELVRTLEKTDAQSSYLNWDLENDYGIPIASGVYIYHVDAPGIGTKTAKLVVFIEKERLARY